MIPLVDWAYAVFAEAAGPGLEVDYRLSVEPYAAGWHRLQVRRPDGRRVLYWVVRESRLLGDVRALADLIVQGCDPESWETILLA